MEFRFNPKKTFDIFHELRPILGSETIVQEEAGAEEGGGGGCCCIDFVTKCDEAKVLSSRSDRCIRN